MNDLAHKKSVMKEKKNWYEKWWVILLLWPIFLFIWLSRLIWNQKWDKKYRVGALIILWGFVLIYGAIQENNSNRRMAEQAVQPKWECTGPDGKKIGLSKEQCDEFNEKWKQGATSPSTSTTVQPTKEPEHDLEATVKFSEEAFLITNDEDRTWTDCQFKINPSLFGDYTYKYDELTAHDSLIIPFREFTKGDGTRFNSYATKAKELSISCKVNGVLSFGYYTLK